MNTLNCPAAVAAVLLFSLHGLAAQGSGDLYDETTLRRVDVVFSSPNYWSTMSSLYGQKQYIKCDLKIDGVTYKDVGVRFRGNSSYFWLPTGSQKRSFKISMDEFVPDQKIQRYNTLNFNNNFLDPSWVREIAAYSVLRDFLPTPKCNFIHLYINGVSWGPYLNTQQINKSMLDEWFESADGNRYRGERADLTRNAHKTALTWLGTSHTEYAANYELKLKGATNPWTDLIGVCDTLNNTPATNIYDDLPKVLDVDNALWIHAGATVLTWLDSYIGFYCHNFYLYTDITHGRMVMMPWDTNNCFGTYVDFQPNVERLSPFYNEFHASRPLFTRLVANPRWRQRYLAHIRTIVDTRFDWKVLGPQITRYRSQIDALVKADTKGIYTYQQFLDSLTRRTFFPSIGPFINPSAPGVRTFSVARAAYLRGHTEVDRIAPTIQDLRQSPSQPTLSDETWVTAKVTTNAAIGGVHLYYRHRGPYVEVSMFDDGNHHDGLANDGVYGQKIPRHAGGSTIEYYVSAQSTGAQSMAMTFAPRTAANRPPRFTVGYPRANSPLVIGEFMAKNSRTIKDQQGDYDDWLELHNTSGVPVDVGGMFLSDKFDQSTRWMIPSGVRIPSLGYLIFWCDNQPGDGPLHTNFKLDGDGEWIGLFATSGRALIDDTRFGRQQSDVSTGRFNDSGNLWVTLRAPTPSQSNVMACGSRSYDARDPFVHRFSLELQGAPRLGTSPTLLLTNGPQNSHGLLFLSSGAGHVKLDRDVVLLLDGSALVGPYVMPTDSIGSFTQRMPIPNTASTIGVSICLQVGGTDTLGLTASNAIHLIVCR